MFAKACGMGLEGIVSKQAEAPYLPGRQRSWLKSKCTQRQEFIIIGYSDCAQGRTCLGCSLSRLSHSRQDKVRWQSRDRLLNEKRPDPSRIGSKASPSGKPVLTRPEVGGLTTREWQSIHWVKPVLAVRG